MQMIYNSPSYCVFEFRPEGAERAGGFEILDKSAGREIYLDGVMAAGFRESVDALIARQPTLEEIDAFLSRFGGLMQQPLRLQ